MPLKKPSAGLQWGDFDFTENQVHIQRDIDYTDSTAQEGELKTRASHSRAISSSDSLTGPEHSGGVSPYQTTRLISSFLFSVMNVGILWGCASKIDSFVYIGGKKTLP